MSKTITVRFDEELLSRLSARLAGGNRNAWITDLVRRELEHLEQVGGAVGRPAPKQPAVNGGVNNLRPVSETHRAKPKREMSARELADPGLPKKPTVRKLRPDDLALLEFLGGVSSTDAKRACAELGWLPGRYAAAERALLSSGRAVSRMGLLVKA